MIKSLLGFRSRRDRSGSSSPGKPSRLEPPVLSSDPPPAYSLTAPPAPEPHHITSDDDPYAFLSSFDTIFLVDDSGSMTRSSWQETEAALRAITPICTSHDADGVDIFFLNHHSGDCSVRGKAGGGYYCITSPDVVHAIFRDVKPAGVTPTGARLRAILKPYLESLASAPDPDRVRPVNIIVITDGRPTDDPESVIKAAARRLDLLDAQPHQVGIQFFQVGRDPRAAAALRELDDELAQDGVRDMVDAVTWDTAAPACKTLSADAILKVVLGAVVRRLDRRPSL